MMFQNSIDFLRISASELWYGVLAFIPNLIIAIIIFIIGWIVGALVDKIIMQIFKSIKVDQALRSAGVEDVTRRAGYTLNSGAFVGGLVKWFIIVVFLVASLQVLGLTQVNEFLQGVVLIYLPRVIVAVLILLVAVVIGDVMQKIVAGSAKAAHVHSANLLGKLTKWAIWIFALITVLIQLGIGASVVQTLFTGFVVAISLALGLAFGLGGQAAAAEAIAKMKHEITDHNHIQ